MDKFLETIAGPLANLFESAAGWLDHQVALSGGDLELPEGEPERKPRWVLNDRGGFDPVNDD